MKKFQVDKSFDFIDEEFEDKNLFNNKYIDEDWEIALLVYPELEKLKDNLSKYSYKLSLQFQFYLLETKEFNKLNFISERFIDAFLERKFGSSLQIKTLSKMLIENDHSKKAKYLNKLIKVLGSKSENRILKTFSSNSEVEELFSEKLNIFEKKINLSFSEKYQNSLVITLLIFLFVFILVVIRS